MNINILKIQQYKANTAIIPTLQNSGSQILNVNRHALAGNSINSAVSVCSLPAMPCPCFLGQIYKSDPQGAKIFEKYLKKLDKKEFDDVDVYYNETKQTNEDHPCVNMVLLKEPEFMPDAIETFLNHEKLSLNGEDVKIKCGILSESDSTLKLLLNEINRNPKLRNRKIKGLMGSGVYSTAFLTEQNTILKLSIHPLYPGKEHMIDGVDLPIYNRYFISFDNRSLYGVEEPLTENSQIRDTTLNEFKQIYLDFQEKIKKANPEYVFAKDFSISNIKDIRQIGYIGDKAYLIDRPCIENRPLYWHSPIKH